MTENKKIIVTVDVEIKDFIPDFLSDQLRYAQTLRGAAGKEAFDTIQGIAHKIFGAGRTFGFDRLSDIGKLLEEAAKKKDRDAISRGLDELTGYLGGVEIVYGPVKKKKRVLIADDTVEISRIMDFLLKKQGFETRTVEDGKQCFLMAKAYDPDLIILDIVMPGVDGLEALKRLKEDRETKDIGVIVCSAKSDEPTQLLSKQLGAYCFVPKPFRKEELLNKVAEYFVRRSPPQ